MRNFQRGSRILLSLFGTGYIKGGGTVASLEVLLLIFFFPYLSFFIFFLFFITGLFLTWKMEDKKWIVIDEACGMSLSLIFIRRNLWLYILAFMIFRILDIWKLPILKKAESIRGGIMLDDVLAGLIAGVVSLTGEIVWRHLYL